MIDLLLTFGTVKPGDKSARFSFHSASFNMKGLRKKSLAFFLLYCNSKKERSVINCTRTKRICYEQTFNSRLFRYLGNIWIFQWKYHVPMLDRWPAIAVYDWHIYQRMASFHGIHYKQMEKSKHISSLSLISCNELTDKYHPNHINYCAGIQPIYKMYQRMATVLVQAHYVYANNQNSMSSNNTMLWQQQQPMSIK